MAVEPVSCGVMDAGLLVVRQPRADDVRPHSLWWARQASGMCGGDGTAMWGEPRAAAECTCTAREFGRCARPTVRPGRDVHDERDHGDGSSTRPRGRRPSGSLTETRDWQYLPERFDGSANRHMNPCSLDGTDPLPRHVLAACVEPDGPVDADGDQARVIDDARHPAFLPGGEAARPSDAATGALVRRPRRRRGSWQRLVAHRSHDLDLAWLVNGLAAQSGIEPSGP